MLAYPDLVRRLALACASQQTRISVGSDAHRPPEVAQAHRQSAKLLREVGIRTVRVWKQLRNIIEGLDDAALPGIHIKAALRSG